MSNQKNGNFLSASSSGHSGKSHCGGDQDRDKDRQKIEHRVTSNPKPSLKHLRGYLVPAQKKWPLGPPARNAEFFGGAQGIGARRYSAASSFFERLTLAKGSTAGPFRAVPSGANWDPWHGQSQHCSSVFQCATHPRCVQAAECKCN
jgi:hypothetical protein